MCLVVVYVCSFVPSLITNIVIVTIQVRTSVPIIETTIGARYPSVLTTMFRRDVRNSFPILLLSLFRFVHPYQLLK